MPKALLLVPALFSAATALTPLVQLPYPLAWGAFALFSALTWAGVQRYSLRLLTAAWLGFLLLSGIMAGYAADELNRSGSGGELLSLGLGLGILLALVLRPSAEPQSL